MKNERRIEQTNSLADFPEWDTWPRIIRALLHAFPGLGEALQQLFTPAKRRETYGRIKSFEDLDQYLVRQDREIISKFRQYSSPRTPTIADLSRTKYRDMIKEMASDEKYSKSTFLRFLNYQDGFITQLGGFPKPKVRVDVERDLSKISYYWEGNSLTVHDPQLLWDCTCGIPAIPELGIIKRPPEYCKIHREKKRAKRLTELFKNELVEISFAGITVYWKNERDMWPPSIDTLYLVDFLSATDVLDNGARSVIDVGSGTGFIGLWIAHNIPSVTDVTFTDWLFRPLLYSALNAVESQVHSRVQFQYNIGSGFRIVMPRSFQDRYDVAVCNPPYLPLFGKFENMGKESTVAGTALLEEFIGVALLHGKRAFVSFSSIVLPEARKAAANANVHLNGIGEWRRIPFRVNHALENVEYLKTLKSRSELDGRGFEVNNNLPHAFEHSVRLHEITRK